jgi:hypothetical protein
MPVTITCPFCNFSREIPEGKIPPGVKWATCPRCKHRFEFSFQAPVFDFQGEQAGEEEAKLRRGPSPWERRSDLGLWQGLYQTFKGVLFSPEKLFSAMTHEGGLKEPLAYGLLLGSVGSMLGVFWQFLMVGESLNSALPSIIGQINLGFIFMVVMIMTPFYILINMFVVSGILHLCLVIMGAARNGFEGTFRIVAFSQSIKILGLVPIIGGLIGWVWHFIVQVIGLREMHETSYLRTIIAMLLPVALIFVVILVIMILYFVLTGS